MKKLNYKKGAGAVVGIIIIIIVLLVGAIYFFGQKAGQVQNQPSGTTTSASGAQADDVSALQQDASSMNFDNLGSGADSLQ